MTDYSRWRSHEKDFRELQQQHPELYADYCLERAKLARRDELTPIEDLSPTPGAAPEQSPISRTISVGAQAGLRFPKRSAWLRARLAERSWNRNDPLRQRGPDPKTID